jgi:hypothetical protein
MSKACVLAVKMLRIACVQISVVVHTIHKIVGSIFSNINLYPAFTQTLHSTYPQLFSVLSSVNWDLSLLSTGLTTKTTLIKKV